MRRVGLFALAIGFLLVVACFAYHGGFTRVRVDETMCGPYLLVYRGVTHREGATNQSLFKETEAITSTLASELKRVGIDDGKPFNIFYPEGSPHRADIGFIVSGSAADQARRIDASTRPIPSELCMVVEFPYRSPLSYLVGHAKVDPAFATHRQHKLYAKTPAYALNAGETIVYMQPIQRRAQ